MQALHLTLALAFVATLARRASAQDESAICFSPDQYTPDAVPADAGADFGNEMNCDFNVAGMLAGAGDAPSDCAAIDDVTYFFLASLAQYCCADGKPVCWKDVETICKDPTTYTPDATPPGDPFGGSTCDLTIIVSSYYMQDAESSVRNTDWESNAPGKCPYKKDRADGAMAVSEYMGPCCSNGVTACDNAAKEYSGAAAPRVAFAGVAAAVALALAASY